MWGTRAKRLLQLLLPVKFKFDDQQTDPQPGQGASRGKMLNVITLDLLFFLFGSVPAPEPDMSGVPGAETVSYPKSRDETRHEQQFLGNH